MNWYLLFYLYTVLEGMSTFFYWIAVPSFIISIICFLVITFTDKDSEYDDSEIRAHAKASSYLKIFVPLAIIFWMLIVFIPGKKDLLLIIAGGAVGEFVTTDSNAKQLPADITKFLRAEILSATAELMPNANIEAEKDKLANMSSDQLREIVLKTKLDSLNKTR